ncbi:MAG: hypothetical protein H7A37_00940 [Chlamydiales bacterium]|nr:hypothetical protein [Chlamydiales bacterium]
MTTINVCLDIDGVLCCSDAKTVENASFYHQKGAIIDAVHTYYVFPGVMEFIRLLYRQKNITVSFYSNANAFRNYYFVRHLLKRSLGEEEYRKVKNNVVVLSKQDRAKISNETAKKQFEQYGITSNQRFTKKDLTKIDSTPLNNMVLIDDKDSNVFPGQEANFLKAPSSCTKDYLDCIDGEQHTKIPCLLLVLGKHESEPEDSEKQEVIAGNQILVIKNGSNYELGFLELSDDRYEQLPIPAEGNKELIEQLDTICHQGNGGEYGAIDLKDSRVNEVIYQLVRSNAGETKAIYTEINRICYVAGMLFKAIELAEKNSVTLSEQLFKRQFLKLSENRFKPCFDRTATQKKVYLYGLQKLKEVNSSYSLITPVIFRKCINLPLTRSQEVFLKDAIGNECG